jgi:hypothetical protein
MTYYLCAAGTTLRNQIDDRWPNRKKASDGWIGDASHQAGVSDHNPDYSAGGVVRAIDIDCDLSGVDKEADVTLANQLIRCARNGDAGGRLKYVIHDGMIASGTYASSYWKWRTYDGEPHREHIHVSFTTHGDDKGGKFPLPVFVSPARARRKRKIRRAISELTARIRALAVKREAKRKRIKAL